MTRIRVRLLPEGQERVIEAEGPLTAGRLLEMLGLSRESHVVMVNGRPVPEPERLDEGEVVVVRVLSGG